MVRRVVIAGCRDYTNYEEAREYIDCCISDMRQKHKIIVVSGGAKGADALGERYAKEHGLCVERHPAEWERYGRGAGPKRNREMAQTADMIICFWDEKSKGTKSMIGYAQNLGKRIYIKKI